MLHKRLFRLCLAFAIVLCTGTTAASTPTARTEAHCVYLPLVSTPELVTVSNVKLRGTRFQDVAISGEVFVTTSTPVYSVTLEVRSYDDQGNLLATVTSSPTFVATLPGQPNPFYFNTGATDLDDPVRAEVRVVAFSRTHPQTFLPVTVTVTSYYFNGTSIRLAGTLTNEHPVPLENIYGVAWIDILGGERSSETLVSRIAPFETVPFVTGIFLGDGSGRPGDFIPYKIVAQGVVP